MSSANAVADAPKISKEVEVLEKAMRRQYTAEYKRKVLAEADTCREPGQLGALLRREGLYFSNLKTWREQRRKGELAGLAQKRRGPAPKENNPLAKKVAVLEREVARHKARAERAEALVELQKKVSEILGIELKRNGEKD